MPNRLPDRFIGAQQERLRNRDVESLRRFHVYSQLELAGPLDRQVVALQKVQRFMGRVLVETNVKHRFTEHDLRAKLASDATSLEKARALLRHAMRQLVPHQVLV